MVMVVRLRHVALLRVSCTTDACIPSTTSRLCLRLRRLSHNLMTELRNYLNRAIRRNDNRATFRCRSLSLMRLLTTNNLSGLKAILRVRALRMASSSATAMTSMALLQILHHQPTRLVLQFTTRLLLRPIIGPLQT